MRAVDVNATVEAGGLVQIKLPRLSVVVETEQARRLRDVLGTVLPERIEDLMHDPRVTDVNVLRAARTILAERGQDTESVEVALYDLTDEEGERKAIGDAAQLADGVELLNEVRSGPKLMLLTIMGGVEPVLSGAYGTEAERIEAAQDYRRAHGPEDGVYRVDVHRDGLVLVDGFTASEVPTRPRRCCLCGCDATGEAFGFAVCGYHAEHTEDDAPCPKCHGDGDNPMGGRRVVWVSTAWIDGRNATVASTSGWYQMDAYEYDENRDPQCVGQMLFTHYTDALGAGEKWARKGEWDTGRAKRVGLVTPRVLGASS